MGIVKIKKELKSNVEHSDFYDKQHDILPGVSLSSLNTSSEDYHFDFGTNSSSGMNNGKLKTEIDILPACLKTFISATIKIIIFFIILYFGVYYLKEKMDLTWFSENEYLVKDLFWSEFLRVGLIIGISLLVICFIAKLFINGSIKKVMKKFYLTKVNMYIYYGVLSVYNVFVYVLISVIYFLNINNAYDKLENIKEAGKIVDTVNIELFNLVKYGVVIVISVFIALNVLRGISIVYKNNKFIIEEEL